MDAQNLVVGSRIDHPVEGKGTVTFVGTDYLGIEFEDGREALIRRESLEREEPILPEPAEPSQESLPWPASTFIPEGENAQHYLGSHWDPFVDDSMELMGLLPEIVPNAMVQTGYGESRKPARSIPEDWPKGFELVWPLRTHGLALIIRPEEQENLLVCLFPFFATGSQHTLTLREVSVWAGGLEAQITASWGEGEVTFFDTQYLVNRAWYEAGKVFDFILSGIAYSAGPAEKREWQVNQHSDVVAWLNQRREEGEKAHKSTVTIKLDGTTIFLPVSGWDSDDYSFRAPVKSVTEFKDWLGQDGWRVRATVMRFGDDDADLDIMITRRAWSGDGPPQVGQDIEGRLWLQGYLWMPRKTKAG